MDEFQQELARIALDVAASRGFVLGGGHAVQLHGMAARPSDDIDLLVWNGVYRVRLKLM